MNTSFGQRLKEAFQYAQNIKIAKLLNVNHSTISTYMNGRIPPPDKLIEITKLTNCNLNWLLTGEGESQIISKINKPQGLILQGSKGGIGTSLSASLISLILAHKGYRVLLVDDILQSCSFTLLANFLKRLTKQSAECHKLECESLLETEIENLDFYFPKNSSWHPEITKLFQPFNLNSFELSEKYDFVIFDARKGDNPFGYQRTYEPNRDYQDEIEFSLEPILRSAKVIVPFKPFDSSLRLVERMVKFSEQQKKVYPNVEFLGLFLAYPSKPTARQSRNLNAEIKELKQKFGVKIFKTIISYDKRLDAMFSENLIPETNTKPYMNYLELVNEILEKLNFSKIKTASTTSSSLYE